MKIVKRNGEVTDADVTKIVSRLSNLCDPIDKSYLDFPAISNGIDRKYVDPTNLAAKVMRGLKDMMKTHELDVLAAEQAASQIVSHPDFDKLAARITVSNLHKSTGTRSEFSRVTKKLRYATHPSTKEPLPVVGLQYYQTVMKHADRLDRAIDYKRDFLYSYFAVKNLEYSYLLKMTIVS